MSTREPDGDSIAKTVLEFFKALPKNGKPQPMEYTVLAGFVVSQLPEPSNAQSTPELRVVALGTGTKCLSGSKRSSKGDLINDSHAEAIARRALLAWLIAETRLAYQGAAGSIFEMDKQQPCKLSLKPSVRFHMYVSQPPCGDASIIHVQCSPNRTGSCTNAKGGGEAAGAAEAPTHTATITTAAATTKQDAATAGHANSTVKHEADSVHAGAATTRACAATTHAGATTIHAGSTTSHVGARTTHAGATATHDIASVTPATAGADIATTEDAAITTKNRSATQFCAGDGPTAVSSTSCQLPPTSSRSGSPDCSAIRFRTGAKYIRLNEKKGSGKDQEIVDSAAPTAVSIPSAGDYEEGDQEEGALRRKPGKGDPTLSLSCSDKLGRWAYLGIQGSLLGSLMEKPLYLSSLVVSAPSDVFALGSAGVHATHAAVQRAVGARFSNVSAQLPSPFMLHPPRVSIVAPPPLELGLEPSPKRVVGSGASLNWSAPAGSCKWAKPVKAAHGVAEVTNANDGCKAGVAKAARNSPKSWSRLCKASMMQAFCELLQYLSTLHSKGAQVLQSSALSSKGGQVQELSKLDNSGAQLNRLDDRGAEVQDHAAGGSGAPLSAPGNGGSDPTPGQATVYEATGLELRSREGGRSGEEDDQERSHGPRDLGELLMEWGGKGSSVGASDHQHGAVDAGLSQTYAALKTICGSLSGYQDAWRRLQEAPSLFSRWIVKPAEQQAFCLPRS